MEVVLQDSSDHKTKDVTDAVRQWLQSMYLHLSFDDSRIILSSKELQSMPAYPNEEEVPVLGGVEEIIIYLIFDPLSLGNLHELDQKFRINVIKGSTVSSMEVTSYYVRMNMCIEPDIHIHIPSSASLFQCRHCEFFWAMNDKWLL